MSNDVADFTIAPQQELEPWAQEMLQEQEQQSEETAEPAQQDPAANDVLLFSVPMLASGDAEGLAQLLREHPDLYEQILATAAGFLGNDTVARAIELLQGPAETPVEPLQEEATPEAVVEQQAAEATTQGTEEAAPEAAQQAEAQAEEAPSAEPEPEPGWVVRARGYNAAHEDEVRLFNHATGFSCTVNGELDPNAVANWQAANGVSPDGRVGKETADAAWALMPVEAPQDVVLPDNEETAVA